MKKYRVMKLFVLLIPMVALLGSLLACDQTPLYEHWDSIVLNELEISPSYIVLQEGQRAVFSVAGGKKDYSFELSGSGAIALLNNRSVEYSSPLGTTEAWIKVRDVYDGFSLAQVLVEPSISVLMIVPANSTLGYNETVVLAPQGGKPPFTFMLEDGLGTVDATTGLYSAPSEATDAVVRLEDSSGQYSDAAISVRVGLQDLAIAPSSVVLETDVSQTFSAVGGLGPYSFAKVSGPGSIDVGTGIYSSATEGSATVSVTDSNIPVGYAEATITVVAVVVTPLVVVPRSINIKKGTSFQFTAEGGIPPYTFEMHSGYGGSINSVSGLYTAPGSHPGNEKVKVVDSRGMNDIATVKVKNK